MSRFQAALIPLLETFTRLESLLKSFPLSELKVRMTEPRIGVRE
jgi:hypothetical protein